MFGIDPGIINMIQSILLVISALLILIAVVGVLRIDRNLDNVVYARIHILGIVDVAGIIAFLALGQPLFALIYLFLAPLLILLIIQYSIQILKKLQKRKIMKMKLI